MKILKELKALKEEPYLLILFICFIGGVAIVAFEYRDVLLGILAALLGGALGLVITLVLPVVIIGYVVRKIYEVYKSSR